MQNDSLDHCSDADLEQEIKDRGLEKQLEDFSDADIAEEYESRDLGETVISLWEADDWDLLNEIRDRGLEDEILDYDIKESCESILSKLNTGQDVRSLIVELVQNVTGKIVCK